MNNFFNNLKKESENIRLSQAEKQTMRLAITRAIETTVHVKQARKTLGTMRAVKSPYLWFSPRLAVPVAAVLVGVLGTGTAYASQAAVPGDTLYAIKVNVTEPALGALAFSDEAKAQWHAEVAETRLEEAEILAAEGKLNAQTSATLAANFDEHSDKAVELAQKVEDKEPGAGIEIAAQIDSSLEAHDEILSKVAEVKTESKAYAETVALKVRGRGSVTLALAGVTKASEDGAPADPTATTMAMQVEVQKFSAVEDNSASTSATTSEIKMNAKIGVAADVPAPPAAQPKAMTKLKKSASSAISEAKKIYNSAKQSLDATTTAAIEADLVRMQTAVEAAASAEVLTDSLKEATKLKAYLKASKKLKRNFFKGDAPGKSAEVQSIETKHDDTASSTEVSAKGESEVQAEVKKEEENSKKNEDPKDEDSKQPSILRSKLNAL